MEILNDTLQVYLGEHCDHEAALLRHIDRETHLKVPMARMLSGHFQGRILSFLSKILQPKRILEIGTFTGYATLCLAEGLCEDGFIHTIDNNEELEDRVRQYFEQSDLATKIKYHIGSALNVIPTLSEVFDLVFIDADKKNNATYYDLVFSRIRKGGVIVVDNVLWGGKILDEAMQDKDTNMIREFNDKITRDNRVEKFILPVRDGLFIIRKITD